MFCESLGIMNIKSNDVIHEPKQFWVVRESILLCVLIIEIIYFIYEPILAIQIRKNDEWLTNLYTMLGIALLGGVVAIRILCSPKRNRTKNIFIYSIMVNSLWMLKAAGFDNFANRNMNTIPYLDSYEFIR